MEERLNQVVSLPTEAGRAEEQMLGADLVREMVARKDRGEGAKRIARELGVDRKTLKRWLRLGQWQPRRSGHRPRLIDRFAEFIEQRAPEVDQSDPKKSRSPRRTNHLQHTGAFFGQE